MNDNLSSEEKISLAIRSAGFDNKSLALETLDTLDSLLILELISILEEASGYEIGPDVFDVKTTTFHEIVLFSRQLDHKS